jgi:hypothetical protein
MDTTTEVKANKTADKTAYMREYKRKQYKEKGTEIKEKNKAYYYKYKFNITADELHKYDTLLPIVVRIRKELDELKDKKPELINELLAPYITQPLTQYTTPPIF